MEEKRKEFNVVFPEDNPSRMHVVESSGIPIITVSGSNLPAVWEKSVLATAKYGYPIATQYDKPGDPFSRDCTMVMVIEKPFEEPRIHRSFPAGPAELEVYRLEVVEGAHDHWICPEKGMWTYTYHKRLCAFPGPRGGIDQIDYICQNLATTPFSRRAQGITWNPVTDPPTNDPPCLQRIWARITGTEKTGLFLNVNTNWRSRDAYKAAFMNIFAITDWIRVMAERISELMGVPVQVGRYVDISDSYHIYGSYFNEFEGGFLQLVAKRSFENRTWPTSEPNIQEMFAEGRARVAAEERPPDK